MQTILLEAPRADIDAILWARAALRECLQYGEHAVDTELDEHGHEVCFNCGGRL